MPLYEYQCTDHGAFDAFRPFAESDASEACPDCGASSPRKFSVPRTRQMAASTMTAMSRNEQSAHSPRVCGSGCGHAHAGNTPSARPRRQAYTGSRPWVIEHA